MRKKDKLLRRWLPHGKSAIVLSLLSSVCALTLIGCASKPTISSADCPQTPAVPATLKESASPKVRSLSQEVQTWLKDASAWLKGYQPTRTP